MIGSMRLSRFKRNIKRKLNRERASYQNLKASEKKVDNDATDKL